MTASLTKCVNSDRVLIGSYVPRSVRDAFAAIVRRRGLSIGAAIRAWVVHEVGDTAVAPETRATSDKVTLRLRDRVVTALRREASARGASPTATATAILEAHLLGEARWTRDQLEQLRAMRALLVDVRNTLATCDADAAAERVASTLPLLDAAIAGNVRYYAVTRTGAAPTRKARARVATLASPAVAPTPTGSTHAVALPGP